MYLVLGNYTYIGDSRALFKTTKYKLLWILALDFFACGSYICSQSFILLGDNAGSGLFVLDILLEVEVLMFLFFHPACMLSFALCRHALAWAHEICRQYHLELQSWNQGASQEKRTKLMFRS